MKNVMFAGALLVAVSIAGAQDFLKENTFPHGYHVTDEEMSCATCHAGIEEAATLKEIPAVKSSACTDCHEDIPADIDVKVTHRDNSFRVQKPSKEGELFFSHKNHIGRVDGESDAQKCQSCHGAPVKEGIVPEQNMVMASCVSCHETKQADNSCTTCHPSALKPVSHKTGLWMKGDFHGRDAVFKKDDCSTCHKEEESCSECHMGLNGKKVHKPNYEYTHGMDVKFKTKDCAVCHVPVEQFCGDCHLK